MVRLNLNYQLLLLILLLLVQGSGMSTGQTRFDWKASEGAPEHYPMEIINGEFRYHDNPSGEGLYVPSGATLYNGWGRGNSLHVTGDVLKPLPDKLDITFFSYLEDQFYRGSFDLPYDTILHWFQEAEAAPKRKTAQGEDLPNSYTMIVGVAPGGTVAVWMKGRGGKEVFFGKAEKIEMNFAKAFRIPIKNKAERAEYVQEIVEDVLSADILAAIRKNDIPFDKWANYRKTYDWIPTFPGDGPSEHKIIMGFFNGEGGTYQFPLEKSFVEKHHPVPDEIRFSYFIKGESSSDYFIVTFDEDEIIAAFSRLGAKQLPMQLEFIPALPFDKTQVWLRNKDEAIQMKKIKVK